MSQHHLFKHGYGGTKIYDVWKDMMKRCYNNKSERYHLYGGRGIVVIERWHDIKNFVKDMGFPLGGYRLERINNNGNYELSNCKWATQKEQMNNTRLNRFIEFEGLRLTVTQWAEFLGITNINMFQSRISRGIPFIQAATNTVPKPIPRKRKAKQITFAGITKSYSEWAEFLGINHIRTFRYRLQTGWGLIKAATTPLDISKSRTLKKG